MPIARHSPKSIELAVELMARAGAAALGGGTELVESIDQGLAAPDSVVDLRAIEGENNIVLHEDGGARLGAAVRLAAVAGHPEIRQRFGALAEACASVGTPEIRDAATLGGNLCQRPRCSYFRRRVPCRKNGGDSCPAVEGENRFLAILLGGPCWIVHPSDVAVALVALEATIEVRGVGGTRRLAASEFFLLPNERLDLENVLGVGEFVVAIELPAHSSGGAQRYLKTTHPDNSDYAVVSLAAVRRRDGEVRLVLGGVAPIPYRVYNSIEEDVGAGNLDDADIETLAARALYDADPLSENGYKVAEAERLVRRGIGEL